jgi:hypothetical protein
LRNIIEIENRVQYILALPAPERFAAMNSRAKFATAQLPNALGEFPDPARIDNHHRQFRSVQRSD